jgi:hypothetical protein
MFPPISFISFELLSCNKVWQVEIIWAKNYLCLVCVSMSLCVNTMTWYTYLALFFPYHPSLYTHDWVKTRQVFVGEVCCWGWIFLTSKIICWPEWVRGRGFTAALGCFHLFERTFWLSEGLEEKQFDFFFSFFKIWYPDWFSDYDWNATIIGFSSRSQGLNPKSFHCKFKFYT